MYALTMEDLSHLGGPMGTEYTTTSSPRYFKTLEEAKAAAQKHWQGSRGGDRNPLKWVGDDWEGKLTKGRVRTEDLGWIMYHIEPVVAE